MEKDIKRLRKLAGLNEGWLRQSSNKFTCDMSDISNHPNTVHCPKCKHPIIKIESLDNYTVHKDADQDVVEWAGNCPKCKALLAVIND